MAGFVLGTVYGLALLPFVPHLAVTHPVVLELVSGSLVAEVTVGALARVGEASLTVGVLAAVPGSMMFDWVYWWAGRRWGDRSLHLLMGRGAGPVTPRAEARLARLERFSARFGRLGVVLAYFLPVPSVLVYAAAGLGGMRLRTFLLLDLLGTLLWIGLVVGLGYAIGRRAIDLAHRLDHYSLLLAGVIVAVIVLRQVVVARRG